jgi:hypothetical protein
MAIRSARSSEASETTGDNSSEELVAIEAAQLLSVVRATTPASSPEGLVAQINLFKEDLGYYALGNASPAHELIFDKLLESVINLRE